MSKRLWYILGFLYLFIGLMMGIMGVKAWDEIPKYGAIYSAVGYFSAGLVCGGMLFRYLGERYAK